MVDAEKASENGVQGAPVTGSAKEYPVQHASDITGQWGPLQRNATYFYIGIYVIAAFNNLSINFYAPKLEFWCKRPAGYENAALQQCESYENSSLPCTEWEYDKSFYWSTMTEEFNLVCGRAWLRSMAASIYQIGYAIACLITGLCADKYGRLAVFKWCIYLELVASLSQALAINVEVFLISRFFLSLGAYGRFAVGETLLFEIAGPKTRARVTVGAEAGWCIGYLILPWVNYFVPHFRYVQLASFFYELVFLFWLPNMPESPRWQLTHGQFAEAEKSIMRAATMKGKLDEAKIREKVLQLKQYVEREEDNLKTESKKTILDLWKVPQLLKFCLVAYALRLMNGFVYYGFSYNAGSIGGSVHLNVFLQALSGSCSLILLYFIIDRFPRKQLALVFVTIQVLVLVAIIPFTFSENGTPYTIALSTIGLLCLQVFTSPVNLIVSETFPTTLRQMAKSSYSMVGRFGSMAAPFLSILVEVTHVSVMMGSFAAMGIISGLLILLLPETHGREIPDTLEEATTAIDNTKNMKKKIEKY